MKRLLFISIFLGLILFTIPATAQNSALIGFNAPSDKVQALKDTLATMALKADNALFKKSCEWFAQVIDAQDILTKYDSTRLAITYDTFCINNNFGNCREYSSYTNRQRPLIIAWQSPTDGKLSFATVILPKDWNPDGTYPLYIYLHGLSSSTNLAMDYLTRFYLKPANTSFAYEDGYLLLPWGRGNLWYDGISKTDILECRQAFEKLVNIDVKRQYLTGHSMGGYGSWYIASCTANMWAALGVEAGALGRGTVNMLADDVVQKLINLPTYFVVGTHDGLFGINQTAYELLTVAGNKNTAFVTFDGAHEHLDANEELLYLWMKEFVNENYSPVNVPVLSEYENLKCYPNPFHDATCISFSLEKMEHVKLCIYNYEGILLEKLIDKSLKQGLYEFKYNAKKSGANFYFCVLEVGGKLYKHKILVQAE